MAENYGPFDTVAWSQDQWYRFAVAWAPSGVIDTAQASYTAGTLSIGGSGLNPTLSAGRAWVRGAGYENTTTKTIAITANANVNARIDRIVLRRDLAAKTVTAISLTGTPASSPVAPALTQVETGVWDVPLFQFRVPANSGTSLTNWVDERTWIDTSDPLSRLGGLTLVKLTQAAYDALGTKDASTLYVIVG